MSDVDTNPTEEVSDEAVEERLSTLFADEPEEEAPEEDTADTEEEAAPEPETTDDVEEVEYEGKAYKVPKELKGALLRESDYTKKTQEVANLRRQVEDKTQFVAVKEKLLSEVAEDIAELRASEKELERYKALDWQALHSADPGQAFALSQRQRQLEQAVADARGKLGAKAQHLQAAQQQHIDQQWALAAQGFRQRVGKFTAEDDKALLQQAHELGFAPEEMKQKLADERILLALAKAAKWDALQQSKPNVNKKASDARPMKVASRSAPQAQRDGKALQAREALRKTGDPNAAEQAFAAMFERQRKR